MNLAIITPIRGDLIHLRRFLDSTLWQMAAGDCLVLCCETDESSRMEGWLTEYGIQLEDNVLLVANQSGVASVAGARNTALKRMAQFRSGVDWVKFLDADDVLAPFALETFRRLPVPDTVHCIAGPQLKVVDGRVAGMGVPDWGVIEHRNPALPSMAFVRREALDKAGGFNSQIYFEEDYDLWLRLRRAFGMAAFGTVSWPVCYYWIDQVERAAKPAVSHEINGLDVREYFEREYAITPER